MSGKHGYVSINIRCHYHILIKSLHIMKYKRAFKSVLSVKLKYINLYNNADLSGEKTLILSHANQ